MWLQVLFNPVRFHPAGSWNGWMTTNDGIMDDLRFASLFYFVVFLTLNLYFLS
jgi:hypothetical protein